MLNAAVRAVKHAVPAASVLVPTLVAAVLVLHDLDARSLWVDEGATFTTVTQSGALLWHWMSYDGGNMLAYYGLEHLIVSIFGTGLPALRLPSALAMVATVPLAHELMRRLLDRRTAFICALFVAVSLPLVYWGQMARGYALGLCFLMAAALAFVAAVGGGRRWWWVTFVVASTLAVYTLVLSVLFLVALGASLLLLPPVAVPWRRMVLAGAAIVVLCAPLVLVATTTGAHAVAWEAPITPEQSAYAWRFVTGTEVAGVTQSATAVPLFVLTLVAWLVAAGLAVTALVRQGRSRAGWGPGLVVLTVAVPIGGVFFLSSAVHPLYADRYFLFAVPPGSILFGMVLSFIRPAWLMSVTVVVVLGLRMAQLIPSYGVDVENWKSAAAFVLSHPAPHDCIAFLENGGYQAFDYYVPDATAAQDRAAPRAVLPATSWSSHTFVADPLTLTGANLAGVEATCPTLWLVTSHVAGPRQPGLSAFARQERASYQALTTALGRVDDIATVHDFLGVGVTEFVKRPDPVQTPAPAASAAPGDGGPGAR